ncbi:hypothetical protein ACFSKN_02660 [Mariniflexile gromovii]|uniref:YD repeat-containing protein n=1 Tax=Mariniflexile gromovii TaxID=362523 RepID=A0ABS4BPM0_9FLAO|nr:hypothetical protein [Mariniflexile gromovii]MBP0902506.1 hypothetical protein [Mariniflexile gromovii]
MKRTVLLFAGLSMVFLTASATDLNFNKENNKIDITKHYRYAQPIVFVERGVEFLIFPDGSFDFNSNYNNSNSRRNSINASYNGPRVSINYSSAHTRSPYISHDRNGIIRSIGDVHLNYDRYGKITRVGSVSIDYGKGKNATLTKVGGLKVNYNHWGEIVSIRGAVNKYNRFNDYHIDNHNTYVNNNYHNDADYYYYKQNGKIKKQKKIK